MTYSSSCHHHFHHRSPREWPLKRRERENAERASNKMNNYVEIDKIAVDLTVMLA